MELIIVGAIIIVAILLYRKLSAASERADQWLQEQRRSATTEAGVRHSTKWNELVNGAKTYPVGLVGEQSYQETIVILREGEPVQLWHEPGNPYDERAIAVAATRGGTIGYIPRDFWLREALLDEGKPCVARVMRLNKGRKATGVVIEVAIAGQPIEARAFTKGG